MRFLLTTLSLPMILGTATAQDHCMAEVITRRHLIAHGGTGVVATAGYFYMAAYGPVTTWSAIKGLYAVPAKPGKP